MAAVKRPAGINFEKILQSVKGDIQEMVQEYQESNLPITDDNTHLHQLCDRLEFILNFGLKERTVLGGRRDVWLYFCKCLAERRNILEGLKIVKANRELKTGVGRSRSFLRYCLVHKCLADVIQQCTEHKSFTVQFYSPESMLLHEKSVASLLSGLYLLCDVSFDLPPTGHDLDVSWPTFARPGSSAWRAPSRTVSMSSLSSFSSQLSEALQYQSPPVHSNMAPVGEDEPTHDCPSSPGSLTSPVSPSHSSSETGLKMSHDEVSELHERLAHLEDDNATLRASCVSLQLKLDQAQQEMPKISEDSTSGNENLVSPESPIACSKCAHATEELVLSQNRCTEMQHLHQRLEDQIKILEGQVEDFERKESDYKCQISTLESKLKTCSSSVVVEVPSDVCTVSNDVELDECMDVDVPQPSKLSSKAESTESVEYYRQKLENLEKMYEDLQEQCRTAEKEKTTMRTNIHKVSANWFERKTRLSESESDGNRFEDSSHEAELLKFLKVKPSEGSDFQNEYSFWVRRMKDVPKLLAEISFLNGKLDLAEKMCTELRKRVREYETVIDDQEIIIHGLKDQLDTYFTDNQKMSKQLSALTKLFEDIELTEKTKVNVVNPPEVPNNVNSNLPTGEDFKEMANSLSKTYIKLKELILEKKSLVTEIERLNVLNVELQRRVATQEDRLISVSDALHTTWMLVSDAKEQHAQLHTHESILRYELKGKRELLHRLREELENSREQWHKIRQMNSKSEEEWNNIREELNERRRVAENGGENGDQDEGAVALDRDKNTSNDFEPPVDLLLDMAIEYGVIEADDETSTSLVAAMEGEDMHASRLQDLEEQCSHLYQKLMASTSRSLTLASRLTALHQHYGSSEDEDEYEDDDYDDDEDEEEDDEEPFVPFETEVMSPEPESYDTAYVSEADTGSASGVAGILSEEEASTTNLGGISVEDNPSNCPEGQEQVAEVEDDLCRGLINFLPRKIEILRRDNQKLEERCQLLQEEKLHSEAHLTANIETERMIRQQLEQKLEHLGKCVDELKLERNGKIHEAEEIYNQKVASLSQKEKEYEVLEEDLRSIREKFEERGNLLVIANERVKQLEKELMVSKTAVKENLDQLALSKNQATEFRDLHDQLNREYKELKEEFLALQQQITDLRFQVSSHTMERDAAQKAGEEKSEALEAAMSQIADHKASIMQLQLQAASQKEMLHNEKEQLATQVEKLNRILVDRDRECTGLSKHLQEAEVALKNAKLALLETQSKLGTNEEETKQLNEDNLSLREKIIQLLREKDALWQANVRLEGAATRAGRSWMDNKSTQECMGCNASFSLTRRRHHCRSCGRIFCTGCSDNWINTAASSRPVRVCDDCFSVHAELATIIATPAVQSNEESENAAESGAVTSRTNTRKGRPLPIGSKLPDDEEFSVISDEELQSSRLSSPSSGSPVSNEVVTETRATTDVLTLTSLAESPPTNAEVWVGAGTRVLVPVDLPAGITLHWHFSSEPKSVSFAVLHQPPQAEGLERSDSEGASSCNQQRVLIPTTRVASAEGATVKGRLQTKQPGVYTLVFDNSCSRLTAKKVTYSLQLENKINSTISRLPETASSSLSSHSEGTLPAP
ncbi:FYVE and coiled-coil domain-containing protein 1 isoform X3 [Palaemon carinicauda]|uniref:FYVE and coiled-coil domain-containing protein 1 isoform X3 n=1 Tax=Palaemon carinicauda TaxID=392227 RepID=UPI0035B6012B